MKESTKEYQKFFLLAPVFLCGLRFFVERISAQNFVVACLLLCAFLFISCKNQNFVNVPVAAPTREITDDSGRRIKIPEKVERAVSLAPNLTEIVFAVGAGERLVGVTTFCNYPAEAQKIQKIGDTQTPNIENIIALKPQIVLVSTASQMENFSRILDGQGITIFVTNPNSLDDIYKTVRQIGEIFGKNEKAQQVVDELEKRVADVEARTDSAEAVKVFLQISREPLFTVGKDSFITDLISRAGGASVTADSETAYPNLSKETAFALNPEAIILSDSEDNREPNDVFKNSPAVRNGKVFKINAELISRPAPRIVDGLEQLAKALHPESFQ
ncbi:MAG TPA: cobalamin-binding protein [Pyrinomonadaceae bacterium]|nr:cobalamin-binding protein [Pyrinomonadaceae bacterium]